MKPILFNTEMVRAIRDNRKSMTRRVVKPQPKFIAAQDGYGPLMQIKGKGVWFNGDPNHVAPYQSGDILYVRETWYYEQHLESTETEEPDLPSGAYLHRYIYKADCPDYLVDAGVGQHGWRPSIHMPKEAARIFLKVTQIEVQRVGDITDEEAVSEGFESRIEFISAFLKMYPDCTEDSWCWVIRFERINKGELI